MLAASERAVDVRESEEDCCRVHYRFCNFCGGTTAETELTAFSRTQSSLSHKEFVVSDDSRGNLC
jgi:hypothetical protein